MDATSIPKFLPPSVQAQLHLVNMSTVYWFEEFLNMFVQPKAYTYDFHNQKPWCILTHVDNLRGHLNSRIKNLPKSHNQRET